MVLVQVVVLTMLMTMIAAYMARWAFQSYQLAWRQQQFTASAGNAQNCMNQLINTSYDQLVQGNMPSGSTACNSGGTYSVASAGSARSVTWTGPAVYVDH